MRKKDKRKEKGKRRGKEKGKRKGKGKGVNIRSRARIEVDTNNDEKKKKVWNKKSNFFFNWSIKNIYIYDIILMSCILRKMYVIAALELYLIF